MGALPTDDNISKAGVSIASGCVCCSTRDVENPTHLFCRSDIAKSAWNFLSTIFNKPKPASILAIQRIFFTKPTDFMTSLSLGLASCTLWEIWKIRNARIYGERHLSITRKILDWARDIHQLISKNYSSKYLDDLSLNILKIRPPSTPPSPARIKDWSPPSQGLSLAIHLMHKNSHCVGAAVVRDKEGNCAWAYVEMSPPSASFTELVSFIETVVQRSRVLHLDIRLAISSHANFGWLESDEDLPLDETYLQRKCLSSAGQIKFKRVSPYANGPAIALAACSSPGSFTDESLLPLSVRRCLSSDRILLGTYFSTGVSSFMVVASRSLDDLLVRYRDPP